MIKTYTFVACILLTSLVFAQPCMPTGLPDPGVSPEPNNITCIERGVFYEQILQTHNFDTLSVAIPLAGNIDIIFNSTTVDSLTNFPCGISWETSNANNTYNGGEPGCIRVFGTTTDRLGQYPLGIYMTIDITVNSPAGNQRDTLSGEIQDLFQQLDGFLGQVGLSLGDLGVAIPDLNYFSRVIMPGSNCPAIDTSANAMNQTAYGQSCSVDLTVQAFGNGETCPGVTDSITTIVTNSTGTVSYMWNTGDTTAVIFINPLATTTYSVVVTDDNGTATDSFSKEVTPIPVAGFTSAPFGQIVSFTNTSTNAVSYNWSFGDGNISTELNPTNTYANPDTFNVTLVATNTCGADSITTSVIVLQSACLPGGLATPGIMPAPANIACIERGVFYEQILQTLNFDSIDILGFITAQVGFTRIDSLVNLPCGLSWETSSPNNTWGPGEAGCIRVYGTSRDRVGQFRLGIYMTVALNVPFLGQQEFSGEISDLIQQLADIGVTLPGTPDVKYFSRVILPGANCPVINGSGNNDLESAGDVCPPFFVEIVGNTEFCPGGQTELTARATFTNGAVSFNWSTGSTDSSAVVIAAGVVSVTVTDDSGSVVSSIPVDELPAPTANFTSTATGLRVQFTNTSTGATGFDWNFGDGVTSTRESPTHIYPAPDSAYNVTLIVTNMCGTDTIQKSIFVTVGINDLHSENGKLEIFPNPNNGSFILNFTTNVKSEDYRLRIIDLAGKPVYEQNNINVANEIRLTLNLEYLPGGIYTVQFLSKSSNFVKRIAIY